MMTQASWESEYQQNPIIAGGGTIPVEKMRILPTFAPKEVIHAVLYVDKAATPEGKGAGSYTAFVLMYLMKDGKFCIGHVSRGHWAVQERERRLRQEAELYAKTYKSFEVVVEQEPGSGGKESAENTIRNLAGFNVFKDKVTGAKEIRAEPFVAQCQNDNVRLVAGPWCRDFLDECETWPFGKRRDQVDAAAGAFNRLVGVQGEDAGDGPYLTQRGQLDRPAQ
jgi:predicted phage terminase large subunit-like protein